MRRWGAIALLLFTLGTASPALAQPEGVLVDGVVAAIDYNAIMFSTLVAYQQAFVPEQRAALALQAMINDNLLAREANRYGQTIASEEVTREAATRPAPGTLSKLEWQQLLATHMLAKRFLDFRFGDFVPVSRDEIKVYWEAHRDRFPGTLDESEEDIRTLLVPAVRARRVAAYEDELRVRYNVRINGYMLPKE